MAELEQPNIVGNYLSNYYAAQQQRQAGEDRQRAMQRQDTQDQYAQQEHDWADMQRKNEIVARAAISLDTPEKWDTYAPQVMQQLGLQGAHPAFSERQRIIDQAMSVKDLLEQKLQEKEFGLKSRLTEANIRQSDAAAAASRALAGVRASGGGVEPGAALSPETVDFMADQYIAGDPSVMVNLGRGAQGAKNIIAVREAIARKVRAAGGSATDVAMAIGEFQGFKAGNRTLGGRVANMGMAVNEANQMADLVVSASKAVPRGQIRVVNDALNAYQSQTGDPKIVAFGAALNSFINAYARAINPTGVPTLADKEHARDMLNTGFTQGQIDAVIGQMKTEMAAAQKAPGITKQELRSTFRNEHGAAAPAAPKSGWSIKRVP